MLCTIIGSIEPVTMEIFKKEKYTLQTTLFKPDSNEVIVSTRREKSRANTRRKFEVFSHAFTNFSKKRRRIFFFSLALANCTVTIDKKFFCLLVR
jgi:hypothetical protein